MLLTFGENAIPTAHPSIRGTRAEDLVGPELMGIVQGLQIAAKEGRLEEVRRLLREAVPYVAEPKKRTKTPTLT